LDDTVLTQIIREHTQILTVEEGAVANGFGAFVAREIEGRADGHGVALRSLGIPDRFVAHGGRAELLREIDLDAQGIAAHLLEMAGAQAARGPSLGPRVMESA
jgi:1-deoxy-D-xylulose-5-phosphate synthase